VRRSSSRSRATTRVTFELNSGQVEANRVLASPGRHKKLVGGARSGKTLLICRAILMRAVAAPGSRHLITRFRYNACRASIGLDTLPKARDLCYPGMYMRERQEGYYELPNGSEIWLGGLDEKERVEKILGQEYASIFGNEASQIPYASWVVALTRLAQVVTLPSGQRLRQISYVDINPTGKGHWTNQLYGLKKDPVSHRSVPDPENYARAFLQPRDNAANLTPEFLASLEALPARARARFWEGVYQDEVDGALWTLELIEETRREREDFPVEMRKRIVVAVDPSGARDKDDLQADEIGITVAALGTDLHGYILEDATFRGTPQEWARRAVDLYHKYGADCLVYERNFGGAMVEAVIRGADPNVRCKELVASRGKHVRAEPVSELYELKKVHHVGLFPELEDELCAFSTAGYTGERSPNRADAAIWAITELMGVKGSTGVLDFYRNEVEEVRLKRMKAAGASS